MKKRDYPGENGTNGNPILHSNLRIILLKYKGSKFDGRESSNLKLICYVNGRGKRNCKNYIEIVSKCAAKKWKVKLAKQDATASCVMSAPQAPIA
jgi:hypothetical protein